MKYFIAGICVAVVAIHFFMTWEHWLYVARDDKRFYFPSQCYERDGAVKTGWTYEYGPYKYIVCNGLTTNK